MLALTVLARYLKQLVSPQVYTRRFSYSFHCREAESILQLVPKFLKQVPVLLLSYRMSLPFVTCIQFLRSHKFLTPQHADLWQGFSWNLYGNYMVGAKNISSLLPKQISCLVESMKKCQSGKGAFKTFFFTLGHETVRLTHASSPLLTMCLM